MYFWLWNDFLPCFLCRVPGNDYLCRLHGNLTGGLFSCEVMQGKKIRPAMDAYRLSEADFVGLAFDTPVPFYDMPVSCGKPLEMGNVAAMMVMMPGELLGVKDVLCTVAGGDSMIDIGIMPGDALFFERACEYHSYDIVLAEIDGERLLKTFYIDENGDKWLVPANQKYQAIKLDGSMVVYFVGKLIGHLRSAPHQSVQSIVERLRAAESVSAASAESGSTASKIMDSEGNMKMDASQVPVIPKAQIEDVQDEEDVNDEVEDGEDLVAKLLPIFYNKEQDVRLFLNQIQRMAPEAITDLVNQWVKEKRISDYGNSRKGMLWGILHEAGLYTRTVQNWNRRVD